MSNLQTAEVRPELRLECRASGSEYFRIWSVNVLLTIVTLGIYSAWAKVRRERYFHSATTLDGASFEYHGNPIAILKGRVIAFLLIGAYQLAARSSPLAATIAFGALAAVMPLLLWRSLQFRLYNTSYRGIRFGFGGSTKAAYKYFLMLPLFGSITLGLAWPFAHARSKRFVHSEARYGDTQFECEVSTGAFYKMWLKGFLLVLVGFAALAAGSAGIVVAAKAASGPGSPAPAWLVWMPIVIAVLFYPWFFAAMQLVLAQAGNEAWNNTTLAGNRFVSTVRWTRLTFIVLTNALAVVCTLGLYYPFARVRLLQYQLSQLTVVPEGSLDDFVAAAQSDVGAVGEGAANLLDFDLSL